LTEPAAPIAKLSHRQVLVVFSGLMTGMLLAALDQTIVATALPTIVGELGGLEHLSWVVTAYLLTSTASSPLYGKISDLYGRRRVFQFAIVMFLIGSALAGMSRSMGQLIAFRAVQGLGAGGLFVLALTIIGDILSPRERGRYQGYMGSVFAFASVAGPLLGGLFVDHLTWRWIFYINLPLGAVALVVTSFALNLPFVRRPHRIDYAGAALLVAGVSSLLLVTVWGGTQYPWGSPTVVGLGAAGAILTGLFLAREHHAAEPILPLRLFRNRVFTLTGGAAFILGFTMLGATIFLPLFLQVATGASATNSGLLILPLTAGIVTMSITTGRLITRTGRYKFWPVVGTVFMACGLFLLSRMDPSTSRLESSLYMLVLGLGLGMVMQVLIIALQNAVEYRDLGIATSTNTFFRSLGGAFGAALFGAILTGRLAYHLPRLLPPNSAAVDPALLTGSPAMIRTLPPAVQTAVGEAFARSIVTVFRWAIPFAVLSFILVLAIPEHPLRDTAHIGAAAPANPKPPETPVPEAGPG
jgi:EmrB/QacA subfamily drug resistance transporter